MPNAWLRGSAGIREQGLAYMDASRLTSNFA